MRGSAANISTVCRGAAPLPFLLAMFPEKRYTETNPLLSFQITLPRAAETMEYRAFGSCSSLRSAVLPEGIAVLPDSLFMGCTELQSVGLPGSVVTIDENVFAQCGSLTDVIFGGTQEQWDALDIQFGNERLQEARIQMNP